MASDSINFWNDSDCSRWIVPYKYGHDFHGDAFFTRINISKCPKIYMFSAICSMNVTFYHFYVPLSHICIIPRDQNAQNGLRNKTVGERLMGCVGVAANQRMFVPRTVINRFVIAIIIEMAYRKNHDFIIYLGCRPWHILAHRPVDILVCTMCVIYFYIVHTYEYVHCRPHTTLNDDGFPVSISLPVRLRQLVEICLYTKCTCPDSRLKADFNSDNIENVKTCEK